METTPKLLQFVDYEDARLRRAIQPIQFPLDKMEEQLIQNMLYSIQKEQLKEVDASWESAAGMAANQWGINKRIFLYCPEGDSENNIEVIINPSYEPIPYEDLGVLYDDSWEACFSVPLCTGYVRRYTHIRVTYQNEKGEIISRELSGWPARVWQHENDHLDGMLYDCTHAGKCLEKKQFASREEIEEFYTKVREARKKE